MTLTGAHYIYILFMIAVLITMIMKKESVVPCILGIFSLGIYYDKSLVKALCSVLSALGVAMNGLCSVILIIGIMVALSKALEDSKFIDFMVGPISKIVKNHTSAFFISGIFMLLMSWFFWPSPATALVGAIFLPISKKAGLPAIGLAMAVNLFGHGIALSQSVPFNKVAAAFIETLVGGITGLDGSSFSGMSLGGSTASVFGIAIDANIGALATLGQIAATWVGGGCIVPWALAPVAAICGVKPLDLAKRNFIPVMVGLVVTTIVAIFII